MQIYYGYADNDYCIYEVYTLECEEREDWYTVDEDELPKLDFDQRKSCKYLIYKSQINVYDKPFTDKAIFTFYHTNQQATVDAIEDCRKQNKLKYEDKLKKLETPTKVFDN